MMTLLFPTLLFPIGAACGALDEFEETIVDETTIPGSTMTINGPFSPSFTGRFNGVDLSSTQSFRDNDVSPGDVDGIFVKAIRVEITTGAQNADLDRLDRFIERLELWVEAGGQPRISLAVQEPFPMAQAIDLAVDPDLNLKPYATSTNMTIGANVRVAQDRPVVSATMRTTVTLLIDINLLGS